MQTHVNDTVMDNLGTAPALLWQTMKGDIRLMVGHYCKVRKDKLKLEVAQLEQDLDDQYTFLDNGPIHVQAIEARIAGSVTCFAFIDC